MHKNVNKGDDKQKLLMNFLSVPEGLGVMTM